MQIELDLGQVQKKIHFEDPVKVQGLIDRALSLIVPRAVFKDSSLDCKQEQGVVVEGIALQSKVLRKNLEDVGRVFPFVLSIGAGLEEEAAGDEDLLDRYLLDKIGDLVLIQARRQLQAHLQKQYGFAKLSSMSPGSLPDWPLEEQQQLFALLGDVQGTLGVRLSESCLMLPRKSVSGLYFPTEVSFFSCQLCPRQNCEERKGAYDPDKVKEYGLAEENQPQTETAAKPFKKNFWEMDLLLFWV